MRVIFIHGFGENDHPYSVKIAPFIPGEHVFLDVWELLVNKPLPRMERLGFC